MLITLNNPINLIERGSEGSSVCSYAVVDFYAWEHITGT